MDLLLHCPRPFSLVSVAARSTRLPRLGIVAVAFALAAFGAACAPGGDRAPVSEVARLVQQGEVQRIVVSGQTLDVKLFSGEALTSRKEEGVSLAETLRQYGVDEAQLGRVTIEVVDTGDMSWMWSLIWFVPLAIFILLLLSFRRAANAGGGADANQAFSFAKSRARKMTLERPTVSFADVAGVPEAKEDLQEIVEYLRNPWKFAALGARIPKGVLLVGPPGTGKTLLARAVAGEAAVPFFSQAASEFVELFVGVGASRVRDLFKQAKENAPSIVFVDEIDAIGRKRGGGFGQSHEEREQTLNQILAELDGFDPRTNVIVMAATNRADVLDTALLRPGRFDRRVTLESPDRQSRVEILNVHIRGKPLDVDVDIEKLARLTPGFSGADIENMINEAALMAARRNRQHIGMSELEDAIERVVVGPQKKGHRMSPREKEMAAYHEAGHALVAHLLPNTDPVHKISIVARGASGGHTRVLPEEDRRLWTRSQLQDMLAYTLGGMAAEKLVYGESTTGPGSDLDQATRTARKMVAELGMSDVLGPASIGGDGEMDLMMRREVSDQTIAQVDSEVRKLLNHALARAVSVLDKHRERLEHLSAVLQDQETLQGDALTEALGPAPARAA